MDDERPANPGSVPVAEPNQRRPWWARWPVLLLVGVLPVPFGLYFLGLIGIALLLADRSRPDDVRAGAAVLMAWWIYSFRQGATSPYISAVLLVVAAVFWARATSARRQAGTPRPWVTAVPAALALATALAAFVPYGWRAAELSSKEALSRALEERAAHPWRGIRATQALVEDGRVRFVHTPVWYVALYEPNADVALTADGQPCFTRREVWQVNAVTGSVSRETYDESRVVDDPCLPLRKGTAKDLVPVPT